ncbi:hypothetical protein SteCoe_15296 [Stentor coeruleus]|uniref:Myb-like DNA-binding domain containing protein n=1 Tax=Stentor coeruleus TaxID=5963 RepID=A0A1R2C3Y8_9CILI|nr:hypothetical protein SteCoe_15296 [Stentor coeruleus]
MVKCNSRTWTSDEDLNLTEIMLNARKMKWNSISKKLCRRLKTSHKTGKQCRERWVNYLNPKLLHEPWTNTEEEKLIEIFKVIGKKWTKISAYFKNRSANSVKNHFYALIRKNIRRYNKYSGAYKKITGNANDALNHPGLCKLLVAPSLPKKKFETEDFKIQQYSNALVQRFNFDIEDNYEVYQKNDETLFFTEMQKTGLCMLYLFLPN